VIVINNTGTESGGASNATINATEHAVEAPPEAETPFVRVEGENGTDNATEILTVQIATPSVIISVYLLMFVPILMAWMGLRYYGAEVEHYVWILPITVSLCIVAFDLCNQSLSVLMQSPMAITAVQALFLFVFTLIWTIIDEIRQPLFSVETLGMLGKWTLVGLTYAAYQLLNHQVSYGCSLSERTVFLGMSPVITVALEMSVLPKGMITKTPSFPSLLALGGMVLGTVIFALQYPDFSITGLWSGFGLLCITIPCRLIQRYALVEQQNHEMSLPVQWMACIDGLFLFIPSSALTAVSQVDFWDAWRLWLENDSIVILVLLSFLTAVGCHVFGMLLLRMTSTTSYIVFHNIANIVIVLLGICYYGDDHSVLVLTGLAISLLSGILYALDLMISPPKTGPQSLWGIASALARAIRQSPRYAARMLGSKEPIASEDSEFEDDTGIPGTPRRLRRASTEQDLLNRSPVRRRVDAMMRYFEGFSRQRTT
jgi:hypothetical protein